MIQNTCRGTGVACSAAPSTAGLDMSQSARKESLGAV